MTVEVSVVERVQTIVEPLLAARDLALYDLDQSGSTVRVTVETSDLEVITELTRLISRALDDADVGDSRYTLEVSSPGLERTLRTADHFARAVGETVSIKTTGGSEVEGDRRMKGTIVASDDDTVTIRDGATGAERTLRLEQVQRARTVFEWGTEPKPAKPAKTPKPAKTTTATNQKANAR